MRQCATAIHPSWPAPEPAIQTVMQHKRWMTGSSPAMRERGTVKPIRSEFESQAAGHRVVVDAVAGKQAAVGGNGAEAIADIDGNALVDVEGDAARQGRGEP